VGVEHMHVVGKDIHMEHKSDVKVEVNSHQQRQSTSGNNLPSRYAMRVRA
jgi:hypothetical protein